MMPKHMIGAALCSKLNFSRLSMSYTAPMLVSTAAEPMNFLIANKDK